MLEWSLCAFVLRWPFSWQSCRVRLILGVNVFFPDGWTAHKSSVHGKRQVLRQETRVWKSGTSASLWACFVSLDFKEFERTSGAACFYFIELVFLCSWDDLVTFGLSFLFSEALTPFILGMFNQKLQPSPGKDGLRWGVRRPLVG